MASGDAKPVPVKNVAFRVTFPLFDADGDLVTGATGLDSEVSKDGAGFSDCTNEATEIGSSGMYYLDLTSTEMNADTVTIIVKTSTSGAKTTPIVMYPQEAGDIPVDVQGISGDTAAADNLEAVLDGTGAAVKATTLDVTGLTTFTGRVEMNAGLAISQSTLNTAGVSITGNGTSNGVVIQGGATGDGLRLLGGATAGRGLYITNTSGVAAEIDGASGDFVGDITGALSALGTNGANLTGIPWNAAWDAEVQSEATDALQAMHLQYLFLNAYDPSSKPGDAAGLLNVLVENDGGVPRYTANALEQGPGGGSAPSAADIADAVWDEVLSGHATAGTAGLFVTENHTKLGYLPAATAGAAGGVMIAGSNAATTLASLTVSGATTLTGNVSMAAGLTITQSTTNGHGITVTGNGTGDGLRVQGGATGNGFRVLGGATSGYGIYVSTTSGHGILSAPVGSQAAGMYLVGASNGHALRLEAAGTGTGLLAKGGASGPGATFSGGSSSGQGVVVNSTSGDGIYVNPTAGHGLQIQANGASKHGIYSIGGTSGTSDGIYAVAGSGGVDIRGAVQWNAAWDAEVQSEVQDAIEANHLDHLLAAAYNPASKPGDAAGLLNILVENDGGTPRYTANALEQGPVTSAAPTAAAVAEEVWGLAVTGNTDAGSFGELASTIASGISALDGKVDTIDANVDTVLTNLGTVDTNIDTILGYWNAGGAQLTDIPWHADWDAEVQSEVQDALVANHLDHLLAAAYDPASKPGDAAGLLNVLFENDGGVPRYTANALELAPTGSAPSANDVAEAVWGLAVTGNTDSGSFGELVNTTYTALGVVDGNVDTILGYWNAGGVQLTDIPWNSDWDTQVESEVNDALVALHLDHLLAAAYDPTSKPGNASGLLNVLVENDGGVPRFTANALEQSPAGSAPSAATIADAVWDELASGHTADGSFGDRVADLFTLIGSPITTVAGDIAALATDVGVLSSDVGSVYTAVTDGDAATLAVVNGHTTYVERIPASPASVGSAMTLANDAITAAKIADNAFSDEHFNVPSVTSGPATSILAMIQQIHRRYFKKATLSATTLVTYADDETTPLTTQSRNESGGVQTLGPAS